MDRTDYRRKVVDFALPEGQGVFKEAGWYSSGGFNCKVCQVKLLN